MNRLREELSDDQRAVLQIIHGELEGSARWPIWQYIDLQIKPRGAAAAALTSMPRLRDTQHQMGMTYGLVWWENFYAVPGQRTTVEMSVAGLHSLGFDELPELYVRTIRHLAAEQAKLVPSPTTLVECVVGVDDLRSSLFADLSSERDATGIVTRRLDQLRLLVDREPPTMRRVQTYPDGTWSLPVEPEIVTYADVTSVDDYLDRLATVIEPQAIPFARSVASPFTIPEAISYLDAVWTARLGRRLFVNVDPARAANLVFTATTPDEFDGRCSALADALSCLAVPADDTLKRRNVRPIVLLGKWLAMRLPESPAARVEEATFTLSEIVNIRVGGQHTADRRKQVEAFQTFGLSYPPFDWNAAWEALRQSATNAIDAIRQEVEANVSHAQDESPTE